MNMSCEWQPGIADASIIMSHLPVCAGSHGHREVVPGFEVESALVMFDNRAQRSADADQRQEPVADR